jgi:two-component system, LytTR family, response regulator
MAKITCIIVEDEKPAQEVLKSYINKAEWIELAATFGDAIQALDFLKDNEVDLIFLDLQIPRIKGLDFLKILKNPPQVIITTAYSQHAIEAFELDVDDYLMKPFSFDRFLKAVSRISSKPESSQIHQFQNVVTERSFAFFNMNRVMVKVMFDDILYVESMREYIYIHLPESKVITKMGIGEAEKMLTNNFLRVHRSFLVNTNKITAYAAEEIFISKISIPIGINYKKMVEAFFMAGLSNR